MSAEDAERAARIEAAGVKYRAMRADSVRFWIGRMPALTPAEAANVNWLYAPKKKPRKR